MEFLWDCVVDELQEVVTSIIDLSQRHN
jgi:hypothetical protein